MSLAPRWLHWAQGGIAGMRVAVGVDAEHVSEASS